MSRQEDWVRITLRLPGDLHQALTVKAGKASLNAQIVELLQAGVGSDETAGGFHYLDAISDDVAAKARVVARFHLAAATKIEATDVVFLEPGITARITSVTGDDRKAHDAAKLAIESAFPAEGVTWGQVSEALAALGAKAPEPTQALRQSIERRLAATPGMAGRVAL